MRFLIKMAFWLGLIAFFLPSGSPDEPSSHGIDYVTAFLGAQEAMGDLGGFCERSPTACEAGGEIAGFVGARVADGFAYAFDLARGSMGGAPVEPQTVALAPESVAPAAVAAEPASAGPRPYQRPNSTIDPMATAAVAAEAVRRAAGLPPYEMPRPSTSGAAPAARLASPATPVAAALPPAPTTPAIPTPAPRV